MKPRPLESYQAAKKYLFGALSKESLCTPQIRQRLKRREVSEEIREQLIEEMIRLGFVDDRAWVEAFVRRQQGRRDGPSMIKMKLRAKGIDSELINEFVSRDDEMLTHQIVGLLKTRYRKYDLSDFKERQKAIAALARKGFDLEAIRSALECCSSAAAFHRRGSASPDDPLQEA